MKKLFQMIVSNKFRSIILTYFILILGNSGFSQQTTTALPNNATFSNNNTPQGALRYQRGFYLIDSAEMNRSGMAANMMIKSIGFTIARAQNDTTNGQFKLYLQNTQDVESRADTGWTIINSITDTAYHAVVPFPGKYEWQVQANCSSNSSFTPSIRFSNDNLSGCNNPYNLEVSTITPTSALLNWEAATSSGFVDYELEYSRLDTVSWSTISTTDTFYTITGLEPGKAYQWRVKTNCGSETSSINYSTFTTSTVSACNPPTLLVPIVINDSVVKISWTAAANATYYEARYKRTGTAAWSTSISFADSLNLILTPGTTYEWQVRTICSPGPSGDYINGANFTTGGTPVCYEPANPVTRHITDSSFTFSWSPVVGATSYTIRYRLKNTITWSNAVSPMTLVCDSLISIPDTTGAYDIPFEGGSSNTFLYTGSGIYVAWEFSRPSGALSSSNLSLSTTRGSIIPGVNGLDSITHLLGMVSRADTSLTGLPDILGESNFRPETRFSSNDLKDSVSVVAVYAMGMTIPNFQSPTPITALIANKSATTKNLDVTLKVKNKQSGAERYSAIQNINVSANDSALVEFNGWAPTLMETDSIIISIPATPDENVINNNSKAYLQTVNTNYLAYDDGTPLVAEAGLDTLGGLLLNKHSLNGCGQVIAASIYLTESATGRSLKAVIIDTSGAIVAESPLFTPGESETNKYHSFYFSSPASFLNEEFYIGLAQEASSTGYNPVGVQWENETTRSGAYYRANIDGSNLIDYPQQGRLMIKAEITSSVPELFIDGNLTLCTGATNVLTAGSADTRFANSVLSFSSQYDNSTYNASQALGTANVFPAYGLSPHAWISSTPDGQREFLELDFPGAGKINFVDVYETANAGAVDSIYTWDPVNLQYDLVYSTSAAATAEVARKNRISFPITTYDVSRIRIAINSPAVPGHNAIDAVSIGKKDLPGTFQSYLWTPGGDTSATKSVTTPGKYLLTITTASGCQLTDSVNVVAAVTTAPVITGISSFCQGDSVVLTSSQETGNTWSTGDTTRSITVLTAGSFTVTYNDGCGSLTSAPFVTTVNPLPTVSISGTLSICPGGSTVLDAGGSFINYFWNTGDTTQTISVNLPGVFNATVTDVNGCVNTDTATVVYSTLPPPVITGNLSICPGDSTVLDAGAGYVSYSWSTGHTSRTITVSTADQFEVTVTNNGGCSASSSVITSLNPAPTPSITGANGFCAGNSVSLTANSGYASYSWSTGATTEVINVNSAGTYTVTVTDNNGCTGSVSKSIIQFANPVPVISGTLSFCGGTSTTLNAGTGYGSYLWSTGATTQTIVVSTVGTFSVTVTNSDGCSASASATTTNTGALPATPGPIQGPAISSCNTTAVYSIGAVPNASHYVWTLPAGASLVSGQGSLSISVNFGAAFTGGYIVVAASNACGQSPSLTPRKLYVQALANMPGAITGPASAICGPVTRSYSISPVPMATSYTWTPPAGATVVNGQGTTSVQILFTSGFSTGNVCVTANNACGSTAPSCLAVSGIPPNPGAISGLTIVCRNQSNLIYSVNPVPGATSYTWTLPQSAQISAGAGTNTIVVRMGPNSGNITVKANSVCGSSTASTLAISAIVCGNRPQQSYSITEIRPVPEVVSSYGGAGNDGTTVLEWTLGEPRIDLVSKADLLYTQGFHQPLVYLPRTKADTVVLRSIKVVAFPNPVGSVLNVKIESIRSYRALTIDLTDLNGMLLQRKQVNTGKSDYFTLQMGGYMAGSYLLVVRDNTGRIITTIKIEKPGYNYIY